MAEAGDEGERLSSMQQTAHITIKARLEEELRRLGGKLGLNRELKVVWMPDAAADLSGEVKGDTIYVYEVDEGKALKVVRHELIDYLITSRIVKPLVELVNMLIKSRESEIYKEKEKLVEMLSELLA